MENDSSTDELKDQSFFGFMGQVPQVGPGLSIGIVGATGIVGKTLMRVLKQRNFPIEELHLYASKESEGNWIETPYGHLYLERLNERKPPHLDLVFMAAGSAVAKSWGWRFARRGAIVIDKSSYFRSKTYAPLVVPEVNPESMINHRGVIANPNCTTIPLVTALYPLHKFAELRSFTAVSFQSVSGAGKEAMIALGEELEDSEKAPSFFPHRIADNVIPWIGTGKNGHSGEELKLISESRKILSLPRFPIRVTAVRVPIFVGHSLAVHATFRRNLTVDLAREALSEAAGVKLIDEPGDNRYPTPLAAAGSDDVYVGRIRRDRGSHGLALWISTDNLRKGAATNAIQIAEEIFLNNKSD